MSEKIRAGLSIRRPPRVVGMRGGSMIGGMFEKGLASIKTIVETKPAS